ncbi:TPA: restriction endonuclease subunit S [Escherichia coli]|uniref:restriction endonuclease subunit S n=2 Tax=Escherichia coli TaxID=562 RepID=UPI001BDF33A2|nr:restriction endonuclease subunit S [Escherichia coli]MCH6991906.1 restriction endonuclease subunit S [Escherichia coli]HDP9293947.1 restriction endonuclease subunit S [Escherichia coli]HDP9299280.1 restriction endonuclease subunit S [Escherichia coli]HDP9344663.1 restriction endonuclease subunit S [Escherichia coli]HDP9400974.1 restriction endonuclease subunit S [Escherichia coli]
MSELSYLEKLLDGVEVEWRNLGDTSLFEIANNGRKPVKASLRIAGETPYYGANNIQDYVDGYTHDGEYVLIAEDGSASLENYSIQYATGKFWANNHVHVVRGKERVHSRFLYHYLCIVNFLPFLTGGGRAKLTKGQLIEIPVPIPCPGNPEKSLAIQSEIVRILDKFTELTAELTAELSMRKKQYNYYRDQLLSFKEGEVKWKTLGEITEINTGQKPSEILDNAATFDYINAGTSRSGYTTMSNCDGDTVTTPSRGQGGIGFVGYQKTPFWLGPLCYKIKSLNNEILINKFLFYTLQSRNRILLSLKKEGGVPAVNKIDLAKLIIPLPSLDEQKRIVSLLDKFDTLTNSITEGLPREIELRQKQYEYYRDLLFSFPKPETVSN